MVAVGLSCGDCLSCDEEGCTIAADNFNRDDNFGDINADAPFEWGGTNTDILLVSNEVLFISGNAEYLTCPVAHPDSTGSGVVSAQFRADTDEYVEVWLNGTDEDNCTVARLTIGTSKTLEIIQRSGGSDTVLASGTATSSAFASTEVTLYYDAVFKIAQAVHSTVSVCAYDIDEVGYLSGVAVGANSGEVYLDDFVYQRLGDGENECPEIGCSYSNCDHYPIDNDWEAVLTISGVADGSCTSCNEVMNTTWIIPLFANGLSRAGFELRTTGLLCDASPPGELVELWVNAWCDSGPGRFPDDGQIGLEVMIRTVNTGNEAVWVLPMVDFPDLTATYISSEFTFVGAAGSYCNLSGVSFTLSFNPP